MDNTAKTPAEAVTEYARQTTGSVNMHRHTWSRILYTDGVKFLADECAAYWLIDAIVSWQTRANVRAQSFQVWSIEHRQKTNDWRLKCEDGNGNKVAVQIIVYSDFPKELAPFAIWLENGTLMLPEER